MLKRYNVELFKHLNTETIKFYSYFCYMKQRLKKHLFIIIGIIISTYSYSQTFNDNVFNTNAKSIMLYKMGNGLNSPVISLVAKDTLQLEFDLLNASNIDVRYEVFLCTKNWEKSSLFANEYLKSIGVHRIENTQNSVNTSIPYVHYETLFPNENLQFLVSGNYIVQVFNDNTNELLFQKRFMIIENLIKLEATEKQPSIVEFMDTHQEVDVSITPFGFNIPNPENDLQITILQNGRWDNQISLHKPSHITSDKIDFDYERENLFTGGAEFHQFNFKNLAFASQYVEKIDWQNGLYYIEMEPNEIQAFKPYANKGDLDGRFSPSHEVLQDVDYVADYAQVEFTLPFYKQKYDTTDVYIVGGFNQWMLTDENKMKYNEDDSQYQASILLKQGYYDYAIANVSKNKTVIDSKEIDGTYYQTENNYEIIVYFYDIVQGYDRIIGYKKINTKK
jgi:hypothetical protein